MAEDARSHGPGSVRFSVAAGTLVNIHRRFCVRCPISEHEVIPRRLPQQACARTPGSRCTGRGPWRCPAGQATPPSTMKGAPSSCTTPEPSRVRLRLSLSLFALTCKYRYNLAGSNGWLGKRWENVTGLPPWQASFRVGTRLGHPQLPGEVEGRRHTVRLGGSRSASTTRTRPRSSRMPSTRPGSTGPPAG